MPIDLPGGIGDAIKAAEAQAQAQQQMQLALNACLQQPHTVEQINANATRLVRDDSGNHILLVATLPGKRFDIVLGPAALAQIVAQATETPAEEPAAE